MCLRRGVAGGEGDRHDHRGVGPSGSGGPYGFYLLCDEKLFETFELKSDVLLMVQKGSSGCHVADRPYRECVKVKVTRAWVRM